MKHQKELSTERIFQDNWGSIEVLKLSCNNDHFESYAFVKRPSAVVIVPYCDTQVLLVAQQRLPVGCVTWELPSGGIENGESPEMAAARELEEETGMVGETFELLSDLYEAPAYSTVKLFIFKVAIVTIGSVNHSTKEISNFRWFDSTGIRENILREGKTDAATVSALGLAGFLR